MLIEKNPSQYFRSRSNRTHIFGRRVQITSLTVTRYLSVVDTARSADALCARAHPACVWTGLPTQRRSRHPSSHSKNVRLSLAVLSKAMSHFMRNLLMHVPGTMTLEAQGEQVFQEKMRGGGSASASVISSAWGTLSFSFASSRRAGPRRSAQRCSRRPTNLLTTTTCLGEHRYSRTL